MDPLKPALDRLVAQVEVPTYIDHDPVRFIHAYAQTDDRLIAGFVAALLAWGRRDIVIRNVGELLRRMGPSPAAFIRSYPDGGTDRFLGWKHRTMNADDVHWLSLSLSRGIRQHGSFEGIWAAAYQESVRLDRLLMAVFHEQYFERVPEAPYRVRKHLSNNEKGGSCKRLYLFLRWTMRRGSCVDAPLMTFMPLSELRIPLDVHVARHARALGLLTRPQDDWKAVEELTARLKALNPEDPAKYDYALFGMGVLGLPLTPEG